MATKNDIVNFVCDLANRGQGVDADGVWGTQCVDLSNWVSSQFVGKSLWGNAINLLDSAESQGLEVIRMPTEANPEAGDIFVMSVPFHDYGHTGIVIEDSDGFTMKTVEQNIDGYSDTNGDGINDQLQFGGPARYNSRDFTGVLGWIKLPLDGQSETVNIITESNGYHKLKDEFGIFTVEVEALNVRNSPSISGEIVATYTVSMSMNYDSVYIGDGYIWISYVSNSGIRRYVACGKKENGYNIAPFGRFE